MLIERISNFFWGVPITVTKKYFIWNPTGLIGGFYVRLKFFCYSSRREIVIKVRPHFRLNERLGAIMFPMIILSHLLK